MLLLSVIPSMFAFALIRSAREVANIAAQAARVSLNHGKGNLSSDQAKVLTGLGGGSIKLQAKQDSDTTPSVEGAAAEGASVKGHLSDSDDGFGEGTVAPIALAVGAAAPTDKAAEKKSSSEDRMQQEGEDALRCFAEMKDQSDEVIHEREMGDLIKDCAKLVGSCRKRSLVHMAKK